MSDYREHDAFQETIHSNPYDLTPRLVYSDFLEEYGLHHDPETLDALRDESDGDIHFVHRVGGKVSARKDQSENISSDPWNPQIRNHHADYLDIDSEYRAEEPDEIERYRSLSQHHRDFARWLLASGKIPKLSRFAPSWLEKSLRDSQYLPTMADQHVMNKHIGFPENTPESIQEWSDNYGGGQMLFSDGSVLSRNSSGSLFSSEDTDSYIDRSHDDQEDEE